MNVNSLIKENVEYKSYKLPVSLYPLKMRESEDGKVKFHARTMFRNKLNMEDIANDLIATGIIKDENSQQIVKLWNKLNGAIIDRVLNGSIVDCGIGILYAKEQKDPANAALIQEKLEEYRQTIMTPDIAAKRGYVSEVIDAGETRERIAKSLRFLTEKRSMDKPLKKHGNIPL